MKILFLLALVSFAAVAQDAMPRHKHPMEGKPCNVGDPDLVYAAYDVYECKADATAPQPFDGRYRWSEQKSLDNWNKSKPQ